MGSEIRNRDEGDRLTRRSKNGDVSRPVWSPLMQLNPKKEQLKGLWVFLRDPGAVDWWPWQMDSSKSARWAVVFRPSLIAAHRRRRFTLIAKILATIT